MSMGIIFVNAAVIAMPLLLMYAWWQWHRRGPGVVSSWRSKAVVGGLLTISINALLYFSWLAYSYAQRDWLQAGRLGSILATNVALPLIACSLICTLVGEGKPRSLVGVATVLGFVMWIQFGVL